MATSEKLLKDFDFDKVEEIEVGMDYKGHTVYARTGFPQSALTYRIVHQVFNQSIEENYFWTVELLRTHEGFHEIEKITDLFSASEHSAFFGAAQQRLGLQQDKVSQFLATIGKMVKELFQLVRELRIIDERLYSYKDSNELKSKSRESAEITLKGIWIDLVEQGSKNPASVFGMARELQFTTLPDLFFSIHPDTPTDVDAAVDALDFNQAVKRVLKRKLRTFMEWKRTTEQELTNRRIFTIKYLRQHFDIIKMYMHWVKPYLRNIQRLQLMNQTKSTDLIAAFEGSLVEIEILAKKLPQNLGSRYGKQILTNKKFFAVVLLHFSYRSMPQMAYQQEYQRGPLHVGKTELTIRAYSWTKEKIEKYLKMKEKEDLELLSVVDASVKAALEALGDELERYLKEAGEMESFTTTGSKTEKLKDRHGKTGQKSQGASIAEPFLAVVRGFGSVLKPLSFGVGSKEQKEHPMDEQIKKNEEKLASKVAQDACYQIYKEFKKKHGMVHW